MKRRERGSSAVEASFGLLILMPLLMGTSVVGINLLRAMQVTQFCRDAGHMFAYGVDFSQAGNQTLLTHLAQGLNMQASGGNGVVIFSTVTFVGPNDCTGAGLSANTHQLSQHEPGGVYAPLRGRRSEQDVKPLWQPQRGNYRRRRLHYDSQLPEKYNR